MDPRELFNSVLEISKDREQVEINRERQHIKDNLRGWLENTAKLGYRKHVLDVRFKTNADNVESKLRAGGFTVVIFGVASGGYKLEIRW